MWPSETNRGESAVGARARVHDHALALSVPPLRRTGKRWLFTLQDISVHSPGQISTTPDEEAQSVTELVSTRAFPNPVSVEKEFSTNY